MLKPLAKLWSCRSIFGRAVLGDIRSMYAGTAFGLAWLAIGPILLLTLYTFIYAVIFRVRVPNFTIEEYIINVFAGLVPFLAFAQGLGASSTAMQRGAKLLANANFLPELVPLKAVAVAYAMLPVGLVITFMGDVTLSSISATWFLVPVVAVLQIMFSMGIALFLSVISLVFRDVQILVQYIVIALLVVTPIAYTPDMIPQGMLALLYVNPLFYYVFAYQNLILLNALPPVDVMVLGTIASFGTFGAGLWFFQKARMVLGDLI